MPPGRWSGAWGTGEALEVAPAVPVTGGGGQRQAAKQEAGCAQKGQGKGLGTKRRKAGRDAGGGGWGGGRGRKNEQKNPRRTKGCRDGK